MKAIAGVWGPALSKRLQKYEADPIGGLIWRSKANETIGTKRKLEWALEIIGIFILYFFWRVLR